MKKTSIFVRSFAIFAVIFTVSVFASCGRGVEAETGDSGIVSDNGVETIEIIDSVKELYNESGEVVGKESYFADGTLRFHEDYNENGDVISSAAYNQDGTKDAVQNVTYDASGAPLQYITEKYYYEGGALKEYNISYYDKRQMLNRSESYNADGSVQDIVTYERDDRGNPTVESHYGEKNYLTTVCYRTYSENGLLTEEKTVDGRGKFLSAVRYEYGDNGKILKDMNLNEAGEITSYCEYTYKDGADAPETRIYVPDGSGGYIEY